MASAAPAALWRASSADLIAFCTAALPWFSAIAHRQFRFGDRGLLGGAGFGFAQDPFLLGRRFLGAVGFQLLARDLALAQLAQDGFDLGVARLGARRADQDFVEGQVVALEVAPHFRHRALLDVRALLQQLDQGLPLADVLEVSGHHRVEGLLDQFADVAEALDHQGRHLVVDVDHHRQRQVRLERILGDQGDLRQMLVQLVRANRAGLPFQDEVRGRHFDHALGVGIERVLAGQEGRGLHAFLVDADQSAVAVIVAGLVQAGLAGIGHDHADEADRHLGLGHDLARGEAGVQVIGAFDQHLQLAALVTAGVDEHFRVLEVVVVVQRVGRVGAHHRRDDGPFRQRQALVGGDHGQLVFADHQRPEAAARHQVVVDGFQDAADPPLALTLPSPGRLSAYTWLSVRTTNCARLMA